MISSLSLEGEGARKRHGMISPMPDAPPSKPDAALVQQAVRNAIHTVKTNVTTYNINCNFEEASAFLFSTVLELPLPSYGVVPL